MMYAAEMQLTFGSLFAGVGGIDLGLEAAGWKCSWQVEWDPNCQQTLSYHWPSVPKWLDVRDVTGYELNPVDVITFGSPCQDLSVAGRRAGFEGSRSSLFFEATRIIKEMQNATSGNFPKWAIWENVAGALSSRGGDDFEAVLSEMANLGATHIEWSILDAQFFGVPQRRRRVFLVCCFDSSIARRSSTKILAIGKGSSRNPKKSTKQGKASPTSIEASSALSGPIGKPSEAIEEVNPKVYSTLRSGGDGGVPSSRGEHLVVQPIAIDGRRYNDVRIDDSGIMRTLEAQMGTGGNNVPYIAVNDEMVKLLVRKLTPIECERLMGWPDNHTLYRADGKVNGDTNRYKMCGNGVASPVAKWVAERINLFTSGDMHG
jgi:DNA (cytosine-5)-methyltransferase 1